MSAVLGGGLSEFRLLLFFLQFTKQLSSGLFPNSEKASLLSVSKMPQLLLAVLLGGLSFARGVRKDTTSMHHGPERSGLGA